MKMNWNFMMLERTAPKLRNFLKDMTSSHPKLSRVKFSIQRQFRIKLGKLMRDHKKSTLRWINSRLIDRLKTLRRESEPKLYWSIARWSCAKVKSSTCRLLKSLRVLTWIYFMMPSIPLREVSDFHSRLTLKLKQRAPCSSVRYFTKHFRTTKRAVNFTLTA